MRLRPQQLDSKTLLYFITTLLAQLPGELSDFNTMELQLELGTRIVRLLSAGNGTPPLTPLLSRLYVERAIEIIRNGRSLDELPVSVGEAYFEFVLRLVRDADVSDTGKALEVVKRLARASLGDRLIPGRLTLQKANEITASSEDKQSQVLRKLIASGLLSENTVGLQPGVQFTLDPVAEFCAAYSYTEECGFSMPAWQSLAVILRKALPPPVGFRGALLAVIRAYADKGVCSRCVATARKPTNRQYR
jgi:hypothetical protein